MHVYSLPPIDWWTGWLTEDEFEQQCRERHADTSVLKDYREFLESARSEAKKLGWEGDMREGPFIAGLPPGHGAGDGEIMVGWKQDNNGTTFIASPYPLPWLQI